MGVPVSTQQKAAAQRADFQRSAVHQPSPLSHVAPSPIDRLQRGIGNRAVSSLLRSPAVQTKLTISDPGDEYEREADSVADHVMRMPDPMVQRKCNCEDDAPAAKP